MGELIPLEQFHRQASIPERLNALEIKPETKGIPPGYIRVVVIPPPGDKNELLILGDFMERDVKKLKHVPLYGAAMILTWEQYLKSGLLATENTADTERISELRRQSFKVIRGGKFSQKLERHA